MTRSHTLLLACIPGPLHRLCHSASLHLPDSSLISDRYHCYPKFISGFAVSCHLRQILPWFLPWETSTPPNQTQFHQSSALENNELLHLQTTAKRLPPGEWVALKNHTGKFHPAGIAAAPHPSQLTSTAYRSLPGLKHGHLQFRGIAQVEKHLERPSPHPPKTKHQQSSSPIMMGSCKQVQLIRWRWWLFVPRTLTYKVSLQRIWNLTEITIQVFLLSVLKYRVQLGKPPRP